MKINFYILDKGDDSNKLTYACRVVHKAFQQGYPVYCHVADAQKGQQLDTLLWTFSQGSFIPHAWANKSTTRWQDYPVQIALNSELTPVNSSHILINLAEQVPADYIKFEHVVELVCQENQDKIDSRNRFRFYRDNGHTPITHNVAA